MYNAHVSDFANSPDRRGEEVDSSPGAEDAGWRADTLKQSDAPDDTRPRVIQRASGFAEKFDEWRFSASQKLSSVDLAPDLAQNIGSGRWFRGFGTLLGLSASALAMWPDFAPLEAAPAMELDEVARDEFRSQSIMPLALGADSGRRMGATQQVVPLASAPERPQIELLATLARGDSFSRMLQRAGVGSGDARRVADLISRTMPLSEINSGTQVDITLGRRPAAGETRPLDALSFRARFDLELAINRDENGALALERKPIRVDDTPLRIRGTVGSGLYRSARAAGAPANAVQKYLKVLGQHVDMDRAVRAGDTFDMIVAYRRAATGERQTGELLYAGIERAGKPTTQLMRWGKDGRYFEASGVGEQRSGLVSPVPGPVTSRYGMRRHPILGYRRMHRGLDFRARYGTPIYAVTDGRVNYAGRKGGLGNFVRIDHGNGLSTGYAHMSRFAVRSGARVRRGQVIGYVGSTGLSSGPHLHYEMYRNGRHVNPSSVRFVTRAQLTGSELQRFRAQLGQLRTIEAGAALEDLVPQPSEVEEPTREIDRVAEPTRVN